MTSKWANLEIVLDGGNIWQNINLDAYSRMEPYEEGAKCKLIERCGGGGLVVEGVVSGDLIVNVSFDILTRQVALFAGGLDQIGGVPM